MNTLDEALAALRKLGGDPLPAAGGRRSRPPTTTAPSPTHHACVKGLPRFPRSADLRLRRWPSRSPAPIRRRPTRSPRQASPRRAAGSTRTRCATSADGRRRAGPPAGARAVPRTRAAHGAARLDQSGRALDDEVVTRLLGEEAARILQTAREAASQIKIRAEDAAARMLREATDEAQRLREEAEVEAARRRQDASADAEAELAMAKQQGREMVNEARAYRERVLSELARRRELARQQIEQLMHGRDRLLQAFERARLVAVDVVAELTPLGEPDEYVNLSPTTGPVPVMVPNQQRPAPETAGDGDDMPVAVTVVEGGDVATVEVEVEPGTEVIVAIEVGELEAVEPPPQPRTTPTTPSC